MARKVKTTPTLSGETPAELLVKYGKVTLDHAADVAAQIGNVPTMGGVQQNMCMLMTAIGARALKEGVTDYKHEPVVQAFFNNYYGPGKGVGRTAKPESVANYVSSYGRWLKAGMFAAWDAKPLALAATECKLTSLSARAALIKSFTDDKKRTVAPTPAEIAAAVAKKLAGKGSKAKAKVAEEWAIAPTIASVRGDAQAMDNDKPLQAFIKANSLQKEFDAMVNAMNAFATALEMSGASEKGKAAEARIRKAALAAAQKATKPEGAVAN